MDTKGYFKKDLDALEKHSTAQESIHWASAAVSDLSTSFAVNFFDIHKLADQHIALISLVEEILEQHDKCMDPGNSVKEMNAETRRMNKLKGKFQ